MSLITSIKNYISQFVLGLMYTTTDYTAIKHINGNRDIKEAHVQDLQNKMSAKGWLLTSVVYMVIIRDIMYVLCGQHRCEAAKRAGIPIQFIILGKYDKYDKDTIENLLSAIQEDSADNMAWDIGDYLHSFCEKGVQEYIDLKQWMLDNILTQIEICLILMGKDNSSRALKDFKEGLFEMGNLPRAELRLSQLRQLSGMGQQVKFNFVFNRNFVRAFCAVAELENFDWNEFKRVLKLQKQNSMFIKQTDIPSYKKLIQDIYNYKKERHNKQFFV